MWVAGCVGTGLDIECAALRIMEARLFGVKYDGGHTSIPCCVRFHGTVRSDGDEGLAIQRRGLLEDHI